MEKMLLIAMEVVVIIIGITYAANAGLQISGVDSAGNKLIYDTDFDITWYDYTNGGEFWYDQRAWAGGLTVTCNGETYDDWRLPSTVPGPPLLGTYGYEGDPDGDGIYTYTAGYNLANSEMGHLYYTELLNKGYVATDGTSPQPGYGLENTGYFDNLISGSYWSRTVNCTSPYAVWAFSFSKGKQAVSTRLINNLYGIAVRPGKISAVPIPSSILLFVTGLASLLGIGIRREQGRKA